MEIFLNLPKTMKFAKLKNKPSKKQKQTNKQTNLLPKEPQKPKKFKPIGFHG